MDLTSSLPITSTSGVNSCYPFFTRLLREHVWRIDMIQDGERWRKQEAIKQYVQFLFISSPSPSYSVYRLYLFSFLQTSRDIAHTRFCWYPKAIEVLVNTMLENVNSDQRNSIDFSWHVNLKKGASLIVVKALYEGYICPWYLATYACLAKRCSLQVLRVRARLHVFVWVTKTRLTVLSCAHVLCCQGLPFQYLTSLKKWRLRHAICFGGPRAAFWQNYGV